MNRSIESIFILILLILFHHVQTEEETILLLNTPSTRFIDRYTIVPAERADRMKRDETSVEHCDEHVQTKLNRCSHLTECQAFAKCLESIKCPSTSQSYGSLIVNLLHLLGGTQCQNQTFDSSCSHEQRSIILHNLLAHWTESNFDVDLKDLSENENDAGRYCKSIHEFIVEVEEEVKAQCLIYSSQVEAFLQNYLCSNQHSSSFQTNSMKTSSSLNGDSSLTKVNETLKDLPTSLPNMDYLDYESDFNFINSNQDLINTTEQTIYVNDHQYYNVSYIIPKSADIPLNFIPDYSLPFISIHDLVDRHRAAFSIHLKFNFPFYGHVIRRILVATGGFIYTGDLLHSSLIGSTQYIAPFMANFDLSLGGSQSNIKYFDNQTHFICTWTNLYLQDQRELGPFTFQTILKSDGNIYFNYLSIPSLNISNKHHSHRIGLSDAYMAQHETKQHTIHVITLYDKINLDRDKIQDGVSIFLKMDNICNTFNDCTSCLANRGKRYNCSWCETLQRCSDGNDRSRHQWIRAQCHRTALEMTCPNLMEKSFDAAHFFSLPSASAMHSNDEHDEHDESFNSHSAYYTFRTIAITLLLTVLILSLIVFVGTYIYAYRHPTSPAGMWLIEHRPSTYIARFKRGSDQNNEST